MNALWAILNVFIDPAETVRRIRGNKLAWALPILLGGLVLGIYNFTVPPLAMLAMRNDPPPGLDPSKLDQMVGAMQTMARISTITAPVMFALMTLMGAAVIFAMSVVLTVNIRFPDLFNLVAHVGLINALQTTAHLIVLRGKGDSIVRADLVPSFGLDMLLSEGAPKLLHGFVGFFSIFTIWHIVVMAIGYAALGGISKGKAFVATAPSWMIGLVFALIGSLFR